MRNFSQRKFSQCVLMLFLLEGFVFFEGDAVVEGLGAFVAFWEEVETDTADVLLGGCLRSFLGGSGDGHRGCASWRGRSWDHLPFHSQSPTSSLNQGTLIRQRGPAHGGTPPAQPPQRGRPPRTKGQLEPQLRVPVPHPPTTP